MTRVPTPWHGICSQNCWMAKEKRCRCKCHGLHHGQGLKKSPGPLDKYMEKPEREP